MKCQIKINIPFSKFKYLDNEVAMKETSVDVSGTLDQVSSMGPSQ